MQPDAVARLEENVLGGNAFEGGRSRRPPDGKEERVPAAGGEENWRATFDDLCAQSNEAMALSVGELNTLIEKCNKLQKVIETEDETVRKVYLKRLQLCKNLYVFVLETKMNEQQKK